MKPNTKPNTAKNLLGVAQGKAARPAPVWLMRQAGRYLPEYRELRQQAPSFLDFCFNPELAVEATLQPIRRFGLDAAILFSDILTVPWALGQKVEFVNGEGPKLEPIRNAAGLDRLVPDGVVERLAPVYRTVQGVAAALPDETTLIGFGGAPWTLAAYMVEGEGSRDYAAAKTLGMGDPATFARLLDILVTATIEHLSAQISAGAEIVQLFDSWAGVLAEPEFRRWVIAPTRAIVTELKRRHPDTPIIGFPRGAGVLLPAYALETGIDVVGLDTQVPVAWAASSLPDSVVMQGNLDPIALLVGGRVLEEGVVSILDQAGSRPLIFNLGHGVLQQTPPDNVAKLLELVRTR